MGHMLRQQLRPKRDAMMFVADKRLITACYHIKKNIIMRNDLAVMETNYFT